MQILFNTQKISITDHFKERVLKKFEQGLGKLLLHYQEDLKVGSISLEKVASESFEIKFDMNLPGCPINIKLTHKILFDGLMEARDQAKRQIKKHLDKLRDF